MNEGIKQYNPNSDRPAEYMGNWADGPVAEIEEKAVEIERAEREMHLKDHEADQEMYDRMDIVETAKHYRDNWDKLNFEEQVEASRFMIDHPEFIPGSGHTEAEFKEILLRDVA